MSFAVTVSASNASAEPIRRLWSGLSGFEPNPSMSALAYDPHITLGIYDNHAPGVALEQALRAVFVNTPEITVRFDKTDCFVGDLLVLWAVPCPRADLLSAHDRLHRLVDPSRCHPHYRPGSWVPHCTLATQVPSGSRSAAVRWLLETFEPCAVTFDTADCVSFPPTQILSRLQLRRNA
jgi:2'-5' RNA ligase